MEGYFDDQGNYIPPPDNSVYRTGKHVKDLNDYSGRLIDDEPSPALMFFGRGGHPMFANPQYSMYHAYPSNGHMN